jgi:hypothetical protein
LVQKLRWSSSIACIYHETLLLWRSALVTLIEFRVLSSASLFTGSSLQVVEYLLVILIVSACLHISICWSLWTHLFRISTGLWLQVHLVVCILVLRWWREDYLLVASCVLGWHGNFLELGVLGIGLTLGQFGLVRFHCLAE